MFKHKQSAEEVIARKDEHYLHGKWIDCKSAILRQEIEQDPVLAAQLAAKKEARNSPSPKKASPPKTKKSSPQKASIPEPEQFAKPKLPKYGHHHSYKHEEFLYEGQEADYPSYDYRGIKEGPYFSPSSYQWNNRYYEQPPFPRSYRHNPQRENPRYRHPQPPPRDFAQPPLPNSRVSPTNRHPYPPGFFGYYPPPDLGAPMMPQPIYNPVPAYPTTTSFRPPSPVRGVPGPMPLPVPVIHDYSPPPRDRYQMEFQEDSAEQMEFIEPQRKPIPPAPQYPQAMDQAIKLNLNFKADDDDDPTQIKPAETSKTLSPDRKAYNLFEGSKESELFDRPPAIVGRYIGNIGARVAEVNSSRNSPRQVEYKKYYSPTQKHRGEVVAKLFEKAITLKPQQTDKTTDRIAK